MKFRFFLLAVMLAITSAHATTSRFDAITATGAVDLSAATVTLPATVTGGGTSFQPKDATLTGLAATTFNTAGQVAYATGTDTFSTITTTSFGRSLWGDADAAAGRATLGLVIGTHVQAWSVNLDNFATYTTATLPVSTATTAALGLKANLAGPTTFTGTVVLPSTTSISTVSATEISYLDGVTSAIQPQFAGKAAKNGSISENFSGAVITVGAEIGSSDGSFALRGDAGETSFAHGVILMLEDGSAYWGTDVINFDPAGVASFGGGVATIAADGSVSFGNGVASIAADGSATFGSGALTIDLDGIIRGGILFFQSVYAAKIGASSITNQDDAGVEPTLTAGAGAGTGPTLSIRERSNSLAGVITVTTGTSPSVASAIVTVTFGESFPNSLAPTVVLWPANAAASALGFLPWTSATEEDFTIHAATSLGLTAATTYIYNYHVIQ